MTNQMHAAQTFRNLHSSGCFVLPNPWDRGTAIFLAQAGYQALATTSAGLGFSQGIHDEVGAISLEQTLAHIKEIVLATDLPVNADFQHGFANEPEKVADNVSLCIETGVAGLSIEDATGDPAQPLYPRELAIERIQASRAAIDSSGIPVVLTARCEAWLVNDATPLSTALDRLVAFAEAGADCIYAPGVRDPDQITAIINAVQPLPVNVLAWAGSTVTELETLGTRRISVGSAMARTAWSAFMNAANSILQNGHFASFVDAVPFHTLNTLFKKTPEKTEN